ncbi:toxin-activating lysine-acyltransferase [Paucibacter sp. R3-3]|uniref:RTX toxin-activating lysine-acyltransferase n=1 Tax=Roseateles agri TaxID=3098619 RepID=A0ABU5DE33_9BURK|nr:toxin-activating lysine-acyltransferase [Paucibacter sp. R3-3]MDY0744003.1 toxin-activating lysine-acyltransferase [Paucibacter sp. R3-3]
MKELITARRLFDEFNFGLNVNFADSMLGCFFEIHCDNTNWNSIALQPYLSLIEALLSRDDLQVFFDKFGRRAGHAICSELDDAAHNDILENRRFPVTPESFRRPGKLWCLDFQANHGLFLEIIANSIQIFANSATEVRYIRDKGRLNSVRSYNKNKLILLKRKVERRTSLLPPIDLFRDAHPFQKEIESKFLTYTFSGRLLKFLSQNKFHSILSIATISERIKYSIALGQFKIYLNEQNEIVGYLSWMWGDKTTDEANNFRRPTHLHDWNDGRTFFVADVVSRLEWQHQVFDDLAHNLFPEINEIGFLPLEGSNTWQVYSRDREQDLREINRFIQVVENW